jgi:hypothetical protein
MLNIMNISASLDRYFRQKKAKVMAASNAPAGYN